MQQAEAFVSLSHLLALLSTKLGEASRPVKPWNTIPGDLVEFSRLLADHNEALERDGKRLIVAFDEYENIDRKIGEGIFPVDLLAMLRDSIQTHRRLTWMF